MELIKKKIRRIHNASNIFNFNGGVDGFSITNGTLIPWENGVRVTSSTADPYMFRNVTPFSGGTYRFVHIKYKVISGVTGITTAQIFYGISDGHSYDGNYYKNFTITGDTDWHVAVVDMSELTGSGAKDDWITHEINRFRYDPATTHPVIVDIDYIAITNSYYPISNLIKTGVTYNVKIGLTSEMQDIGFFDAYMLNGSYQYVVPNNNFYKYLIGGTSYSSLSFATSIGIISGTTNDSNYGDYTYMPYVVTGGSVSRLNELEKYNTNLSFNQKYVGGGNWNVDGVDYANTVQNVKMTYYLGGIKFVDILTGASSGTTFSFTGLGITSPDFINAPIYKNPAKENIISNPKINDDVFIVRQELSAFENNYRLEHVKNLSELLTYAGGKYFKIVNNT